MFSSFDDQSRAALAPLARINYKLTPNKSHYESRHIVTAVPGNFSSYKISPSFHQHITLNIYLTIHLRRLSVVPLY